MSQYSQNVVIFLKLKNTNFKDFKFKEHWSSGGANPVGIMP
jgi:hypothetical protein